jgi:hypothetical protein
MADENPWKKQMMLNKAQNNDSPISKFPTATEQTTPPWVKKK